MWELTQKCEIYESQFLNTLSNVNNHTENESFIKNSSENERLYRKFSRGNSRRKEWIKRKSSKKRWLDTLITEESTLYFILKTEP